MLRRLLIGSLFLINHMTLSAHSAEPEIEAEELLEAIGNNIHGFLDIAFKNDYITARGLLVTNTGLTLQAYTGMSIDLYENDCGWLNTFSADFWLWNDIWTDQDNSTVGQWNEFDWSVGVNFTFAKHWLFRVHYLQLLSPPGNFVPENNVEFILAFDDKDWGNSIVFNPYVKFFWAVSGDSTVVTGRRGNTYDVEIGCLPTYKSSWGCIPLTLTAPTWFTVGPPSFWNGGTIALKNEKSHFGVFSTGLGVQAELTVIPKKFGAWYAYVGGQYYYLINDNLLQAQTVTLGVSSYSHGHRNVGVATASLGFVF